jgi:flagellar protein FlgJ
MRQAADIYLDFSKLSELKQIAKQDQGTALKEVAKQFEAIFVQMLLKQMREASPGDPLFAGEQMKFYQEMHDQQLAVHLAERGGIGLADMLVAQLGRSLPPQATRPEPSPVAGELPRQEKRASAEQVQVQDLPGRFESAADFVRTLWPEAQAAAAKIGVDPKLLLAQAALETGWGKKIIYRPDGRSSYNLFNLKSTPSWPGEEVHVSALEYQDGVAVKKRTAFRAYANYRESFEDYLNLIQSPRYADALKHASDPERYIKALAQAGYATDPNYAAKVLTLYQREHLAAL